MNLLIFILVSLAHLFVKYLDVRSSREFTKLGVKESNPLFRDGRGYFSEWRAWVGVAVIHALSILLFVWNDFWPNENWHPLYALGVFTLSTGGGLIAYYQNKKIIRDRRGR